MDKEIQTMIAKQQAVREAMVEVLNEQRAEIIRRAAAQLRAIGIEVEEAELGAQIS